MKNGRSLSFVIKRNFKWTCSSVTSCKGWGEGLRPFNWEFFKGNTLEIWGCVKGGKGDKVYIKGNV